jgi:hypothetical protein
MARQYRALISIPIAADNDDQAVKASAEYAHSFIHPGADVVAGHLEMVGETRDGFEIARVVHSDPHFLGQLPPDWKP